MSTKVGQVDGGSARSLQPFVPDWSISPGILLQQELDERGMTQAELATRMGVSAKHINQVIRSTASLSTDIALRLEFVLGVPSHLWNNLEAAHQNRLMRLKSEAELSKYANWLRQFPTTELLKRSILKRGEDDASAVARVLAFFGVADPDAYDAVWTIPVAAGFRRAQHADISPHATALWLRLAEIVAERTETPRFSGDRLKSALPEFRSLTLLPDADGFAAAKALCAQAGVVLTYIPEVKGSRVCGVARWLNTGRAMIVLSDRYKYHDVFWFSLIHELAHLLLHPRRKMVLELGGGDDDDGEESAANNFAGELLIPSEYKQILSSRTSAAEAQQIAGRIGVDPGIIAGRLGHQFNTWARYTRIRRKIHLTDESLASA